MKIQDMYFCDTYIVSESNAFCSVLTFWFSWLACFCCDSTSDVVKRWLGEIGALGSDCSAFGAWQGRLELHGEVPYLGVIRNQQLKTA